MAFRIKPRFSECIDCRFYHPKRQLSRCLKCDAGEYFEERVDDRELSANELMDMLAQMDRDYDQED